MANILCYIELAGGEATPTSLETLGQGRRLGSSLGATVYVVLAMAKAPGYGEDDLLATLASGGADKILLVVGEALVEDAAAASWEGHGAALALAWDTCQPALALLPATIAGRELAARCAARVGAAFIHEAFVELRDDALLLAEGRGDAARLLPSDLDFPVVATLPPGRYAAAAGDEEAEVEVLQVSLAPRFVEEPAARAPAPLRARVALPAELADVLLPPALRGADRVPPVAEAAGTLLVELSTGKGPLRIALGAGAAQVEQADFAAEGAPAELLGRLFARRDGADRERER